MYKIILDTDPGVDDAMAIAFALLHPDIELLALTTVFGNVNIDLTTRNAQSLLELFGATQTVVARGAAVPLEQTPNGFADFVHGQDGLGNCYDDRPLTASAPHAEIHTLDAADFIIEATRQAPGEITLVAVGPMTNVAEALRRDPTLPTRVQQLVIMGGTVTEPGNVSPVAEANFYNDPHAADEILAVNWPATIVGLDVTHRVMLQDPHLKSLASAGATGDFLWRCSRFYVDFYTRRARQHNASEASIPACAMHDAAAIAAVIMPDAFERINGAARVITEGVAVGMLALDRKGGPYPLDYWDNRTAETYACVSLAAEQVRQTFLDTIINHKLT